MDYKRQNGSVIGYVLVGVLLAALLVGGILLVKNALPKTENTDTSAVSGETENPDKTNDENSTNGTETEATDDERARNEELNRQLAADSEDRSDDNSESSTTAIVSRGDDTTNVPQTASTNSESLPQTGPAEDALVAVLGAGMLGGSAVAYRRSRSL